MLRGDRDFGGIDVNLERVVGEVSQEFTRREIEGLDTILFLPITGGEGCGKTTLLKALDQRFQHFHLPVTIVKMLGGQETSDAIRSLILSSTAAKMTTPATVSILQASMYEAALGSIAPIVKENRKLIILGDRSPWDAAVYQYLAQGKSLGGRKNR